jgi:glutaminyl-tRNA synthetase
LREHASEEGFPAEVRLYDTLFERPDPGAQGDIFADLNPDSLETLTGCRIEPALVGGNSREAVQFERQGYFCLDPDTTPGKPVFNRTIGLRDTWAKEKAKGG